MTKPALGSQPLEYQRIRRAVELIQEKSSVSPRVGLILGSGLGQVADGITNPVVIPYSDIPGFHGTSVEGHAGRLIRRFRGEDRDPPHDRLGRVQGGRR